MNLISLEEKIKKNQERLLSMKEKKDNLLREIDNLELRILNQGVALKNAQRQSEKPEKKNK